MPAMQGVQEIYLNGSLSGKGGMIKSGKGLVEFSGVNSYPGGTRFEGGELGSERKDAFINITS